MDEPLPNDATLQDEGRNHLAPRKDAVDEERQPLLAAYHDEALCPEAAEQLVRMMEDEKAETHKGEDLPKADRAALLRKVRQPVG